MQMQLEKRTRPDELPSGTFFLDDSNTSLIKYTGAFAQISNSTCQGGTCTRLGNSAASLEFTFNGTDVWLFGQSGGLARVFVDNQLVAVLDTITTPYNGSAFWAATNLNQGAHAIKVAGIEGEGLNLVIDFFSVNGVVTSTGGSSSDPNYLAPEKLTPIIVGSVLGFLAVLALIALCVFLRIRRKKQARISKSEIKLVKVDEGATSGVGEQKDGMGETNGRGGFLSGFLPRRQGSRGFGRGSRSTDGLSPFLPTNSHVSTGSYPTGTNTTNPYSPPVPNSPPTSADPLVPFFARLSSPPQRQKPQVPTPPGVSAAPGASTSTSNLPLRRQDKQAAVAAAAVARPSHSRNNDSFGSRGSEDAPLMVPRPGLPPAYDQAQQRLQQQQQQSRQEPVAGNVQGFPDEKHRPSVSSTVTPSASATSARPPWSATTASTIPATGMTTTTTQSSRYPPEKATYLGTSTTDIPSSPPPSFLEIDSYPAARIPAPAPAAAAAAVPAPRNISVEQAKSMRGPRPRDGSSPRPSGESQRTGQGSRLEEWNRLGGVRLGSNTSLARRDHKNLPESPIDPAVQWS